MKTSLLKMKKAVVKCTGMDMPELDLPMYKSPPRYGTNEGYGSLEEHATNVWTTTTTRFTTRPRWTTTTSQKRRYVQENDDENDVEENVQRRLIKPLRKHGFILI